MKTTKNGDTIKDIVRRGQDTLRRAGIANNRAMWRFPIITIWEQPLVYPQSLGELCIEIAQDRISYESGWFEPLIDIDKFRGGIQQLKQAMWHKETR